MSQFFASGGQSIGASASASVLYEYSGLIEVVCGFTHKPGQAVVHHHRRWLMPRVIVVQSLSHVQLCDPMDCSTPSFPVHQCLRELAQAHIHRVGDAIQPSHPLSSPSPAFSLSQ